MRAAIAALCAALLCIPASVVAGYRLGQDGPSALAPDASALAAKRWVQAASVGDGEKSCALTDARFYWQFFGLATPGICISETDPLGPHKIRIVGATHIDGNTSLVVLRLQSADGVDYVQFHMELSRRPPASAYEETSWRLKPKPRPGDDWIPSGILGNATWKVLGAEAVA